MISVIIPVYNVAEYLDKCLNSVITNTYQDLEVICVNDGSTDNCLAILNKWKEKDSRVTIISHENRGLPEARNSGLDVASGEYITFIDADDYVHPCYFQSLLNCMEKTGADMVICNCQKVSVGEEPVITLDLKPHYRRLTAREFYKSYYARHMVWGRLIRFRDASKLRFPREVEAGQDTLYTLRLISSWEQPIVYETSAQLYYYLQRSNSRVRTHPYQSWLEISEWYVLNRTNPQQIKKGEWAWTLLLQAIAHCLLSRYQAYLWKDRDFVKHANRLLYALIPELINNKHILLRDKISRLPACLFPSIYRIKRLMDNPALINTERDIRNKQRQML